MKKVVLAGTDLSVSRLSFGTASLHYLFGQRHRQKLLACALDSGFTHLDTSPYYGFGLAELELGTLLKGRAGSLTIATKVGLYPPKSETLATAVWLRKIAGKFIKRLSRATVDWSIEQATTSLHDSLRRLRREHVDILFLHEPNPEMLDTHDFLSWLHKQRQLGKIRYWGLAGPAIQFIEWLSASHPLACVLQVYDSIVEKEANVVLHSGRQLQLTYGYLRSTAHDMYAADEIVSQALARNAQGSVLVSTRKLKRIKDLAAIAHADK